MVDLLLTLDTLSVNHITDEKKKVWRHSMTTLQNNCSFFQSKYLTCNVCLLSYLITMYCRIPLHISLNKTSKACHFEGFICEFSHISFRNFDNLATHGCSDFLIDIPFPRDNGHVMRVIFLNIPNNWPIWADGMNWLWGISSWNYQNTICHCVSLVNDFPLINHFF